MPSLRILGLLSGAVALVAIACGSASSSPTGTPGPTASTANEAAQPTPSPTTAPTDVISTPGSVIPTPDSTTRSAPPVVAGPFVNVEPTGLVEQDPDFQEV